MFSKPVVVQYSGLMDPICPLCGIPLEQDKLHVCGVMDWRYCKTCGAKWNPGMYSEDPETCSMCTQVMTVPGFSAWLKLKREKGK